MPEAMAFVSLYPLAGHGGGVAFSRALLQALMGLHQGPLTLVSPDCSQALSDWWHGPHVAVPSRSRWQKLWSVLRWGSTDRFSPFLGHWIHRAEELPATVVLNGAALGRFARALRHRGCRTLVVHHNQERAYQRDNHRGLAGWVWGAIAQHHQVCGMRDAHGHLFLTEADLQRVEALVPEPLPWARVMMPFDPAELAASAPPPPAREKTWTILTSGTLGLWQTEQGIRWVVERVWHRLRADHPEVRLVVVGKDPRSEFRAFCGRHGVEVRVNPPDLNALVRTADLLLCPTMLGSGFKLKLLDGLRNGIPVVAHRVAAAGYPPDLSEAVAVYETPEQCLALLRQAWNRRADTHKRIQLLYGKHFSFVAGCLRLQAALRGFGLPALSPRTDPACLVTPSGSVSGPLSPQVL